MKGLLIFVAGALIGAGGATAFFSIRAKKIRKQHDAALAEMDEYYKAKCEKCGVTAENKEESFCEVEQEQPAKATQKAPKREGSFATAYHEKFDDKIDPAEKEHPTDEPERVYGSPRKIPASSFGSNGHSEKVLYYSVPDDTFYAEGGTFNDVKDVDEIKDKLGAALDKYGFTDENNSADEIYIRYEARKCDYHIVKTYDSLSDANGG